MMNTISIALSGLQSAGKQIAAGASNIANLQTAGALKPENGRAPYTPIQTVQTSQLLPDGQGAGVQATYVGKDPAFVPAYDPDSPFADEQGLIGVPNTDLAEEAVRINMAETAYRANLKVIETASDMQDELLETFDRDV